jgi:DNA-binding NtrC family response regulator
MSDKPTEATELSQRASQVDVATQRFALVVAEGVDRGASLDVDGGSPGRALVGQSPTCALRLRDPQVSRRHAALEATTDGLRVVDLGSTNGTRINGVRIHDAYLRPGDLVEMGATVIRVDHASPLPSPPLSRDIQFGRVYGGSVAMRRLYPLCAKLAASNLAVVIEGETGTGKELLAEALHDSGPRASGPFVVFDCTAVPANLLESALFGHERGAFTTAVASRAGVFEQADGGTLLIDEIGELDVALQPKLLRVLERGAVQRLGGDRWIEVDVRVLAATRRDLDREVQERRFRDDLYFRLAVARIELPPLREREGDIGLLARHFWRNLGDGVSELPDSFLARLLLHPWPGNVRELRNAVARQVALGELALPAAAPKTTATAGTAHDFLEEILAADLPLPHAKERVALELERRYIERVLARHGGNISRAATASGIARRHFYTILARHKG